MLRIICFVVSIYVFTTQAMFGQELDFSKRLVLHFDVNKTIIAVDLVQNKGIEECVNSILANFTFYKWDGEKEQSYYAFLTDKVSRENPKLLVTSEDFKSKRNVYISDFHAYLQQYPGMLAEYEKDKSALLEILDRESLVIFPAFFKLVSWLNENFKDKYVIYLRTFGTDLPEVVPAIEENSELKFHEWGEFRGRELYIGSEVRTVDFFVSNTSKNCAIRDDYVYWKAHNFQAIGGKPFFVDSENSNYVHIFFDDNADDLDKPIICPVLSNGGLADTSELIERGNIVAVNSRDAILNENYFIEKVKFIVS